LGKGIKDSTILDSERSVISETRLMFFEGIKAGIPIAIGYIPIAITFGLLAKSTGIPNSTAAMMSFWVYAGASQFVAVNLLALNATYWEIVLTTFIINFRHFLMSASLSRRIEQPTSKKWMALISFGITDETFTVASTRNEQRLSPVFVLGLNLVAFGTWNAGTWAGVFLGTGLPESIQTSMGIALYAMFIGLLIPSLKKSRPLFIVSMFAVVINSILYWVPLFSSFSMGWRVITATVLASAAGAVFFLKEGEA